MQKRVFRVAPLVLLVFVLSMLFSSVAWAAEPSWGSSLKNCSVNLSNLDLNKVITAGKTPVTIKVWNWKLGKFEVLKPQPTSQPEPTPTPNPSPVAGMTAEEQQMVDLVNQERTSRGLKALTVDMRLVKLARMKSQDMIDKGYFDHNSPTYGSPFDMMKNAGITYRTAGENLAGHRTVQGAHTGLMNSPGHRANILNANFTHIGIGIVDGGRYGKMFTQHFIG
jgi:uncharacterized YkwD family protein